MRVALIMEADEQGHHAFFLQALRDLVQHVVVIDETGTTFEEAEHTLGSKLRGTHTNMDPILKSDATDLAIVSVTQRTPHL